jgi:hypothetical protein
VALVMLVRHLELHPGTSNITPLELDPGSALAWV